MDLFHILLLWTLSWVGGALLSKRLGQWAERYGQRPVLVLCTAFKSINMLGLLACPADPTVAFYLLAPVFMVDAFLNAGIAIANNGFMIKNSPRENRTMFIAAGAGFAGVVGGAASIAAGASIAASEGWSLSIGGSTYVNFHVLFALSLVLRLASAVLATRVREPESAGALFVAGELLAATRVRARSLTILVFPRQTAPIEAEARLAIRLVDDSAPAPARRRAA
jgi:MFS family permease